MMLLPELRILPMLAVLAVLPLEVACPGCGELACSSNYVVGFAKETPWEAGDYVFDIDVDGKTVSCMSSLPLLPCGEVSTSCMDPDGLITFGEIGCGLEPGEQGYAGITINSTDVEHVVIRIRRDGELIEEIELTPEYAEVTPNGEGCPPTCTFASDEVTLP